ncbi:MAG: hypothetical protein P0S96_05535 [Simkaniaceae bacterium]|nr:hypothetical protein [Candidatus Sacchlamyda saccharinae]
MSVWRRKALALFPDSREDIEKNFSLYDFWFDYCPLTIEAHQNNDFEFLKKIYGLAEWCINKKSKVLWNATGTAFYEHLLDVKKTQWPQILPWVSDNVIYQHNIKGLWNDRLGDEENKLLDEMLKTRKEGNTALKFSRPNLYTTNEIHKF